SSSYSATLTGTAGVPRRAARYGKRGGSGAGSAGQGSGADRGCKAARAWVRAGHLSLARAVPFARSWHHESIRIGALLGSRNIASLNRARGQCALVSIPVTKTDTFKRFVEEPSQRFQVLQLLGCRPDLSGFPVIAGPLHHGGRQTLVVQFRYRQKDRIVPSAVLCQLVLQFGMYAVVFIDGLVVQDSDFPREMVEEIADHFYVVALHGGGGLSFLHRAFPLPSAAASPLSASIPCRKVEYSGLF